MTQKIIDAITTFPTPHFSVTDISVMSGTSKETVRRVFQALKELRFLIRRPGHYKGRNWYRTKAEVPDTEVVNLYMKLHRREREGRTRWLAPSKSLTTT